MIIRPTDTSTLPYGYGIKKVDSVHKPVMDMHKEREKQNEEKRRNLMAQKAFIQALEAKMIEDRIAEERAEAENHERHIDIRI